MTTTAVNHLQMSRNEECSRGVEETLEQMSQQLAPLSVCQQPSAASQICLSCGQHGHIARYCKYVTSQVECFNSRKRGQIAKN